MTVAIVSGSNVLNVSMNLSASGTLSGKVTDQVGAAISGVAVSMSGTYGNGSATTAADGTYGITAIVPGSYTVTFSKSGYDTVTK
jgi:protocatechuate 3,4-dioxygenase beta subunit